MQPTPAEAQGLGNRFGAIVDIVNRPRPDEETRQLDITKEKGQDPFGRALCGWGGGCECRLSGPATKKVA